MKGTLLLCALCTCGGVIAWGQSTLDTIGVTALRGQDPSLTGSGERIAQVEAANDNAGVQFEVNPGLPEQPAKLFTWRGRTASATTFPNRVGTESNHADQVAVALYGESTGVAPHPYHVVNYEADYFYTKIIIPHMAVREPIFNQSFYIGTHDAAVDLYYDNYVAQHHTIIITSAGNSGTILSPADCYNGIGVAAYGPSNETASATGPSADGRCKPDITAPAEETSFSAPLVSGAAAVLLQAGGREGIDATAARDPRTVKALLLNGAVKPAGWTHTDSAPLDPNYGAGILNVFNSYTDLAAGRHAPAARVASSSPGHPAMTTGNAAPFPQGWDYRGIQNGATTEAVNHYLIATTGTGALVSTLVWDKGYNASAINNLGLFLYDHTGALVASSTSAVDNVQQLYVTGLPPADYDIEVVKGAGRTGTPGVVTGHETYALVWDFER
jgi:hypothetical protein